MAEFSHDIHVVLSIEPGDIHLWLCFYGEITDQSILDAYREFLSQDEVRQQQRFYFAEDRKRYLVTRALVRTVLSRYSLVRPGEWRFATNNYGRPEIMDADRLMTEISFNVSHTTSLILCGVARKLVLGVDVENTTLRRAHEEIVDRFLSQPEAVALRGLPENSRSERFFQYWTLKEAYVKARGMGLFLPLDGLSFQFAGQRAIRVLFHQQQDGRPENWRFWLLRPSMDYVIGICAQNVTSLSERLSTKRVVPLQFEEPHEIVLLRKSLY